MSFRLQELAAKREEEKKEAQNLALKYNKVVIQHNKQQDRAKFLQSENDKLDKVFLLTIFVFRMCLFLSGLAHFKFTNVSSRGK